MSEIYQQWLKAKITDPEHSQKLEEIFSWITTNYQQLECELKWNQPMWTDHGTFIIGFAAFKNHFSVACEDTALHKYSEKIDHAGYCRTKKTYQFSN